MVVLVAVCLVILSIMLFKYIFNPFVIGTLFILVALVVIPIFRSSLLNSESFYLTDIIIITYLSCYFVGVAARAPRINLLIRDRKSLILKLALTLLIFLAPPIVYKFIQYPFSIQGFRLFYVESRFGGLGFFFIAVSSLLIFLILFFLHHRKYLYSILLIPLLVLFGQKTILLNLIIGILFIAEVEFKVKKRVILTIVILGVTGLMMFHYLTSIGAVASPFLYAINYFDYYDNLTYLIKSLYVDNTLDHFYGEIFITDFFKVIPRFLWTGKPEIYSFLLIHEQLYPELLRRGHTPSFFEPIAMPLADFGMMGVAVFAFLRGYISRIIYNAYKVNDKNYILLFIFLFGNNEFCIVLGLILLFASKTKLSTLRENDA